MTFQTKKPRDGRTNLWAGLGMTACFMTASAILISGLTGAPLSTPASAKLGAPPMTAVAAHR